MSGLLELSLVDAKGLESTDIFGKMDPYVLIEYKDQKLKSKVAKGQGNNPVWNEKFTLWAQYPEEDDQYNLILRIMDKDKFCKDDFVGEVRIAMKEMVRIGINEGTVDTQPRTYNVVNSKGASSGELQVRLALTRKSLQGRE
ncbi:hypothetical protein GIB67_011761 [Kingdonia uniflora]|uniref:C2 domain-containing protein n=1 Tax=Kingdonia uniflora TaxID=39325 RepID=A0A7J7NY49_9MAGN|nr:hypothetical protein GIB67_011761 [Kingdonia uniflora]